MKEEGSYKKIHHIRQDPNISEFGSSVCTDRIADDKNPDILIGAKDDGIYIYGSDNTNKYKYKGKINKPTGSGYSGYFGASMCIVKKSKRTKDLLLVGNKSANNDKGIVHVYERYSEYPSGSGWAKLIDIQPPSGSQKAFGASLFADGDNVYIGALGEYAGAGHTKGAVYVYSYDKITGKPIETIRPPAKAEVGKRFGSSISVSVEKNNKGKIIKKNVYIGEKFTTVVKNSIAFTLSGTVYRYLKTFNN